MTRQRGLGKAGVTALLILGLGSGTLMPLLQTAPAVAQRRREGDYLKSGVTIPAVYDGDQEAKRIILKPDEQLKLDLVTTRDVRSSRGDVLIPEGSRIEGRFEPSGRGTRYYAEQLILRDGTRVNLDATSDVITRTETVRRGSNNERIWQGAIVGAAASAVLSEIFGDIDLLEVLGGAGVGALGGLILGREERRRDVRRSAEVIVVDPDSDLDLTLERDLFL